MHSEGNHLEVDALGQLCRPLGAMQLGQCQALGAAPLVQCGPEAPLERWRPRHARELVAMVILVVAVLVGSVGLPAALLEKRTRADETVLRGAWGERVAEGNLEETLEQPEVRGDRMNSEDIVSLTCSRRRSRCTRCTSRRYSASSSGSHQSSSSR